ncbi:MAG: hypothetical protein LBG19_02665 [Prevotellaceae bacterium]|nr:hypothetical protein [Prevotellaceae bacterium]
MLKNLDSYFPLNRNEELIFKGRVIFIQNEKTYSSAGMLITTAVDNNIGTVVGSSNSYRPCRLWRFIGTGAAKYKD